MIFNETFFENNQSGNEFIYIRQAGRVNQDDTYTITRSSSPTNVIGYILKGTIRLKENEKEYLIEKNTSFLISSNTEYTIFSDTEAPPIMYWCNIRGVLFEQITKAMAFNTYTFSRVNLLDFFLLLQNLIKDTKDRQYDIFKLIFSALCDIKEKEIKLTSQNAYISDSLPKKIENWISTHIQSGFSVKEMSEKMLISVDTANRVFKSAYSMTPYHYYQNMRIEIAKTLLKNSPEMTIEDIAQRLNYTDRNYFSLHFKKETGYSPAYYRKHSN